MDAYIEEAKATGTLSLFNRDVGGDRQGFINELLLIFPKMELFKLDLAHNDLTAKEAHALCKCLDNIEGLAELYLSFNKLGDDGVVLIANSLKKHNSLSWVGLTNNGIGDIGAVALAPVLKDMRNLITLGLRENALGHVGIAALAPVLASLPHLTVLIADNELNDAVNSMREATEVPNAVSDVTNLPMASSAPTIRPKSKTSSESILDIVQSLRAEVEGLRAELSAERKARIELEERIRNLENVSNL